MTYRDIQIFGTRLALRWYCVIARRFVGEEPTGYFAQNMGNNWRLPWPSCGVATHVAATSNKGSDPMATTSRGVGNMYEIVMVLGFLGVWLALQLWILPRLGIQT